MRTALFKISPTVGTAGEIWQKLDGSSIDALPNHAGQQSRRKLFTFERRVWGATF
jgi:hypothetical protein